MPAVVLGISSYNGSKRLDWLLRSIWLRTHRSLDFHVVVVDDGSTAVDMTRAVVFQWMDRLPLSYIEHKGNRGISAGWNTATRALDARDVVLLNDDVIVPSAGRTSWLEPMLFALHENPKVGGVGINWHAFLPEDVPRLLESETSDQEVTPRKCAADEHKSLAPERRAYEDMGPGRVMCPTGQCFAFRRADFDAIGGFDEGYQSFFEESSFGTAMAAQLGKIGMQMNFPMCWHRWGATFAENPELRAGERMVRSRQRYIEQWKVPAEYQSHEAGRNVFDWTHPLHMGAIPDVTVKYMKKDGSIGESVLRQDQRSDFWHAVRARVGA